MNLFSNCSVSKQLIATILISVLLCSCSDDVVIENNKLFTLLDNETTNVHFSNIVTENLYFNFLNYSYIYNGGGIAAGDINNDGLEDLYFTSNQNSNKLYLNKGDFIFEDITLQANVADDEGWSTGTTMIDINNDGWLDIYVCKSGALTNHDFRQNKLYINQKDNTFKEEAYAYGLDHYGFSTQAYFFDYDNDSDLDMYLLNHRQDFENNTTINPLIQQNKQPYNSDQLFRNDGKRFTNVTQKAGIANKAWGLSASIGDFNEDSLLDIYVANDFLESDFLYINQGDGTFKDEILKRFSHISANSMGSDYADINNDLKPDLIVLDMSAEDHVRGKQNMASMSTDDFNRLVNSGYHHQYMSNILQLNNGNGTFSDIGQLSGIAKTDWSWSSLLADFDNDGYSDLFVTNGIEKELSNQDFRNQMQSNIMVGKKVSLDEAINMMPSSKLSNYAFKNNKNLTFSNITEEWGLDYEINACGALYVDLDNDGDLDIVSNNQTAEAAIFKNNSNKNHVTFSFEGEKNNINAIGTKVNVFAKNLQQSKDLFVSRGFQSSVTNKLHFGLGEITKIDSVQVIWSNGFSQTLKDLEVNQMVTLSHSKASSKKLNSIEQKHMFQNVNPNDLGIHFKQKENVFNDFDYQVLLPQKQSEFSSPLAVADVNNDGLEDFFVGNATGSSASLYIQNADGNFQESNRELFTSDKNFEDTDAVFLDVDNDSDIDLYVASGGYEIKTGNKLLQDRLYLNNGKGVFEKSNNLPELLSNNKGLATADYDNDGDIDIFVGGRVQHGRYPLAEKSYLLENNNGKFTDVTSKVISQENGLEMVNDAVFSDFDNDGDSDLIVVGEWMSVTFFENIDNLFIKKEIDVLKENSGWYQSITAVDIDNDNDEDYIIGNWGENNKFQPSKEKPLHIYADYFDGNTTFDMALSKISKTGDLLPVRGKECSSMQTPFLNEKVKTYKQFALSTMPDIYGEDVLEKAKHFEVQNFKSFILKNHGKGNFEIVDLPKYAQFGPTLKTVIHDINNDGFQDIFGVGNVFETEVETVRYDASKGYVLLGNKEGGYEYLNDFSYFNNGEAKTIKKLMIGEELHFIILNKNSELKILKLKSRPIPKN